PAGRRGGSGGRSASARAAAQAGDSGRLRRADIRLPWFSSPGTGVLGESMIAQSFKSCYRRRQRVNDVVSVSRHRSASAVEDASMRAPRLVVVARMAELSPIAISRALRAPPTVSPPTLTRVAMAAAAI